MNGRKLLPKMLAIVISLTMVLMVVGTGIAAPAKLAGSVQMTLSASATTVAPGAEFDLMVSVVAGAQAVDAAQVNLNFDPAVLQVVSTTPGGTLSTVLSGPTSGAGTVDFAAGILGGSTSGTFNLLSVRFRALTSSSGTQITFNTTAPRNSDVLYIGASQFAGGTPITIVVSGSAPPPPGSGVTMLVSPAASTVTTNSQFDVAINVSAGSQPVDSVQANINFDPSFLQVVSVTPGSTLTTAIAGPTTGSGTVDYSAGILGGSATGTFTVMTIRFKAIGSSGSTNISFNTGGSRNSDVLYSGDSKVTGRTGGTVTISSSAIVPTPGPYWVYPYSTIPVFYIIGVNQSNDVTIQTFNFPVNQDFTVRMNYYGTLGIGGTIVAYTNSGAGGSFTATYTIPDWLKGQERIAIRMDSPQGYYSYNWFWNKTAIATPLPPYSSGVASTPAPPGSYPSYGYPYYGYSYGYWVPTFSISSVVPNSTVTIQTSNFPPNQDFTVRMNYYGTLGVGGTVVGTTNSGAGGSFSATYSIPSWLHGQPQIAIRMDSPQGYFAYNWFVN